MTPPSTAAPERTQGAGTETPAAPTACHAPPQRRAAGAGASLRVALVGAPNVGKSALFNRLTSSYVAVSNFPGTSVEVARGSGRVGALLAEVVDTPGLYSLLPSTEEERVTQRILLVGEADVLVHVVDAKNIERMLPLTLQLAELGRPLVVALNMMDEARRLGVQVDATLLSTRLGVPVIPVVAVSGEGLAALGAAVERAGAAPVPPPRPPYANGVGAAIESVRSVLGGDYAVAPVSLVALALQGDAEAEAALLAAEGGGAERVRAALAAAGALLEGPGAYRVAFERRRSAEAVLAGVVRQGSGRPPLGEWLGRALSRPLTGVPILALVLYLGLYKFVGQLGAGTLVDLLEGGLFETRVNPFFEGLFAPVPWEWLRSLFVGEFGVLTLGLRYAVAIILPVVGTFFLFFSVLEDSGYFPRLALLVDRSFKRIGLSGRAVIPMVLGFACDTMATMVTRTLETRRERVLATLLLALAIPCSAQLGVILAVLAVSPAALGVWAGALVGTFLLVGAITARLLPGETAAFHMEIPPLRLPRLGNVVTKTLTRMHWYFLEVLPLFLLASVLLWAGQLTGLLERVVAGLAPVVRLLGLPAETAAIFLFGFFRRDYGAAGLFDLSRAGTLDTVQLTVAAVTLTLFVPCVAQFLMMLKERGAKTAIGMLLFITPFAFGVGFLLNLTLRGLGW
ncbi:MAG TPA: ferrous iron transport protein B [Longimicrobiales bacterium]|nr:ferrous iron transport protein B [Longimicrobiales bacterium]